MPVSLTIIKDVVTYDIADYGLALLKHNIPPNPEKEDYTFDIPGKPGKVRMGSQYKERQFSLDCLVMADDPTVDYQMKLAAIAELFDMISEPAYLIFGDMPGKRFLGEYTGSQSIDKMIFDGNLTIPIVCYFPFSESVTDVSSGWQYGQGYSYGMGLRYGDESNYSTDISTSGQTMTIYHAGGVPYPPKIRLTGAFTNLSISDGTNTLTLTRTNGAGDVIDIDCEEGTVYLNTNTNIYAESNGVFFSLGKGETTFTITGTGLNCTVEFTPFRHRYIY
jgi:phage-related protein